MGYKEQEAWPPRIAMNTNHTQKAEFRTLKFQILQSNSNGCCCHSQRVEGSYYFLALEWHPKECGKGTAIAINDGFARHLRGRLMCRDCFLLHNPFLFLSPYGSHYRYYPYVILHSNNIDPSCWFRSIISGLWRNSDINAHTSKGHIGNFDFSKTGIKQDGVDAVMLSYASCHYRKDICVAVKSW